MIHNYVYRCIHPENQKYENWLEYPIVFNFLDVGFELTYTSRQSLTHALSPGANEMHMKMKLFIYMCQFAGLREATKKHNSLRFLRKSRLKSRLLTANGANKKKLNRKRPKSLPRSRFNHSKVFLVCKWTLLRKCTMTELTHFPISKQ